MNKKIYPIICLVLLFVSYGIVLWPNRNILLTKQDFSYWENKFNQSQWRNPKSENPISDADLYIYAGYYYWQGGSPIIVAPEVPPFGKYVIGAILKLLPFHNLLAVTASLLFLGSTGWLLKARLKKWTWPLLAILSFDPLMRQHMVGMEFMDLFYASLIFFFIGFVVRFAKNQKEKNIIAAALFLGLASATKAFLSTYILGIIFVVIYLWRYRRNIKIGLVKPFIGLVGVSLLVVLLTYGRFFWDNPSLLAWAKVQKWVLNFYQIGYQRSFWYNPFTFIFANRWFVDWQEAVIKLDYWSVLWPITGVVFFWQGLKDLAGFVRQKKQPAASGIIIWPLLYFGFLIVNPYFWPRYILPLLPFFYEALLRTIHSLL